MSREEVAGRFCIRLDWEPTGSHARFRFFTGSEVEETTRLP